MTISGRTEAKMIAVMFDCLRSAWSVSTRWRTGVVMNSIERSSTDNRVSNVQLLKLKGMGPYSSACGTGDWYEICQSISQPPSSPNMGEPGRNQHSICLVADGVRILHKSLLGQIYLLSTIRSCVIGTIDKIRQGVNEFSDISCHWVILE